MTQSKHKSPDESTVLAYVESMLDGARAQAVRKALAPEALDRVEAMKSDRAGLTELCESVEEIDFVDDVLARVERSMLLEDDPIAPVIGFRKSRYADWHRYGAAAVFVLLLGGATIMVGRSLWFDSSDEILAPLVGNELAVTGPGDDVDIATTPKIDSAIPEPIDDGESLASKTDESGVDGDEGGLSVHDVANTEDTSESALAMNIGLEAVLSGRELAAAMSILSEVLQAGDGGVVVNATLSGMPSVGPALADAALSKHDTQVQMTKGRPRDPSYAPPGNGPLGDRGRPVIEERLLPIEEQLANSKRGYEFTLVGSPSDILQAIGLVNQDRLVHRVRLVRPGGGRLLVDLVAPNVPVDTRWSQVMTWWSDPARFYIQALSVSEARQHEPVVSIPLRVVALRGDRGTRVPDG